MTNRLIRIEDTVRVLTLIIGFLGFVSVARYVETPYSLSFAALFFLSLFVEYRNRFPIPRWLLTILALCVIFVTALRLNTDDFVSLAVEALMLLLAIKLLGEKRFRDYMQIYLISLFLLIGSALLSVDIEFLLYFVCMIFLVTVTVVLLTFYSQDSNLTLPASALVRIGSKASLISLLAVPVTALMFVILPRTSYPVFQFLNSGARASTGFTDNVSLGKVSDIQEDSAVILRAHMERVNGDMLYWRGIVLDHFDGTSWTDTAANGGDKDRPFRIQGKQVRQTIYLEPYGNRYLFALDKPVSLFLRRAQKTPALTYTLSENIFRRTKYDAVSTLSGLLPEREIDRSVYLQMPDYSFTRTRHLVKTLSLGRTEEDAVNSFLHFLRDGEYQYSLRNLPLSDNPVEDFLFRYKYGNCEYFASAMVVMLRIAGIPSRVVGGYRGGYFIDAGGYYLVPQKNAHVWVEAYLKDKGWLRADPTPAGREDVLSGSAADLFFKARLLLDSMNYYWNAMVINYDLTKQVSLLNKIRAGIRNPRIHVSLKSVSAFWFLSAMICITAVVLVIRVVSHRKAPDEMILRDFLKTMGKNGYTKKPSEGLEEFASRVKDEGVRDRAYRFVQAFESYFYRDSKISKEDVRILRLLLNALREQ